MRVGERVWRQQAWLWLTEGAGCPSSWTAAHCGGLEGIEEGAFMEGWLLLSFTIIYFLFNVRSSFVQASLDNSIFSTVSSEG